MALREVLAKLGFEVDDSALKRANVNLDGVLSKVTNLKGVIGGALAGVGLGFLKGQIDELGRESSEINKAAIKAGIGFEQFQRIQYQTGLSTEQLTVTFRNLQLGMASLKGKSDDAGESLADLAEGGLDKIGKKNAGAAIKKLGVELDDGKGRALSSAEVFGDVTEALAKVKDPAQQSALAIQIFGRSGADILPLLKKGPEAVRALGEEFDLFGGITEETRKNLAEYGKEQKRLDLASKALRATILGAVVPAFTWLFTKVNEGITWFKKHVDTTQLLTSGFAVLTAAMVAFGGAAALAWAKALIGPALVAAAVIGVIAIVDDLIHFFKGDAKTATEDFIHLLFGKEAGDSIIKSLRDDARALVSDLEKIEGVGAKIKELFKVFGYGLARSITDPLTKSGVSQYREEQQIATLGITRRARKRAASAIGEVELEQPVTPELSAFVDRFSKGIKDSIKTPTVSVAAPGAAGKGPTTIDAKQSVNIVQNITGSDAQDTADKSADGVKGVLNDTRKASLAALEARK